MQSGAPVWRLANIFLLARQVSCFCKSGSWKLEREGGRYNVGRKYELRVESLGFSTPAGRAAP